MSSRIRGFKPDTSASPFRRALQYAFYDWTREMSKSNRLITLLGLGLQGYVIYAVLMWVLMVPKALLGYINLNGRVSR